MPGRRARIGGGHPTKVDPKPLKSQATSAAKDGSEVDDDKRLEATESRLAPAREPRPPCLFNDLASRSVGSWLFDVGRFFDALSPVGAHRRRFQGTLG